MTVNVAFEALEHDARLWEDVSSTLGTASGAVSGFTLGDDVLSIAATESGCSAAYERSRSHMQTLLGEGATETQVIATTLRQVKAAYEASDASAQAQFDGEWEPTK